MKIGYVRSSVIDSYGVETQIEKLKEIGCETIFHETMKKRETRAGQIELDKCLSFCKKGDEFYVTNIYLCANSFKRLYSVVRSLNQKGVSFKAIEDSLDISAALDSGKLIMDLLSILAKFESNCYSERRVGATISVREMQRRTIAKRKLS